MQTRSHLVSIAAALVFVNACGAHAQNLTITNARILDGTGRVIERGSVVVRDGKIASVRPRRRPPPADHDQRQRQDRDAGTDRRAPPHRDRQRRGLARTARATANPGVSRSGLHYRARCDRSAAGDRGAETDRGRTNEGSPALRRHNPTGRGPNGPTAARRPGAHRSCARPVPTTPAPAIPRDATIKAVESAVQAGYDYLKVVLNTTQNGPEVETLKLIVAEGKKHNKPTIVHAVSVRDTLAAIEAKPDMLVHTPHIGNLGDDPAAVRKIVDARIPMTSTLSVFVPHFDANGTRAVQRQTAVPLEYAVERGPGLR